MEFWWAEPVASRFSHSLGSLVCECAGAALYTYVDVAKFMRLVIETGGYSYMCHGLVV